MAKAPGVLYYFTLTMTLLYVGLGFYFILAPGAEEILPGWKHTALGLVFIGYAGYRYVRLRNLRKQLEAQQES